MRHDTSTNMERYKQDFEYLKIRRDTPQVMISLYGNLSSSEIAQVTTFISNYFSVETDLSFDLDVNPNAKPGEVNISWS